MKIIVCGAGNVGRSIVSYLVLGNNDIVVIDSDSASLNAIAKEFDIQPVLGTSSHPEVLEKAGAADADMLIAATGVDEVNMITCEVAASVFNIPKKIARIDNQDFLNPLWGGLFGDKKIPIDLIISPETEIAKAIDALLKHPGMTAATPLFGRKLQMLAFRCRPQMDTQNMSVMQMEHILPEAQLKVFCIIRNDNSFIPAPEYKIQSGDVVYFLTPTTDLDNVIHNLGLEKSAVEKVVIFGGNAISGYLASNLEKDDNILSCRIIEDNRDNARYLARILKNTAVINGDMMSDVILEEAGINSCDAAIAVTPHDKDNLLISLLSKQHNIPLSISLVNASSYNTFIENINSVIVDRSAVIISSMLQELRKARIIDAYSLGHNFGEVWEVTVSDENLCIGEKITDIDMPAASQICALCRKDELIFPNPHTVLEAGDKLIVFIGAKGIKKAEKIFA